jgi:hypothetical protein
LPPTAGDQPPATTDPTARAVCYDNPNNISLRDCGHKLCVECYRQLVKPGKRQAQCPFCRAAIAGFEYRGWPARM